LNYVEYGKENKYDDNIFFQKYSQMSRSQQGLAGAGEWETLRKLLPEYMMDIPGMQDEMRRPMMLIVSANKKVDR
jgi:hypothetical protein